VGFTKSITLRELNTLAINKIKDSYGNEVNNKSKPLNSKEKIEIIKEEKSKESEKVILILETINGKEENNYYYLKEDPLNIHICFDTTIIPEYIQIDNTKVLIQKRADIARKFNEIEMKVYVGVISVLPRAGKGSLINTLYRSIYEYCTESIALTSPSKSKKIIRHSFSRNREFQNLYFEEIPNGLVLKKPETKELLNHINVLLIVIPSEQIATMKDEITGILDQMMDMGKRCIFVYNKIDLVDGVIDDNYSYDKGKSPKISCYSSGIDRYGNNEIIEQSLDILLKIGMAGKDVFSNLSAKQVAHFYQ